MNVSFNYQTESESLKRAKTEEHYTVLDPTGETYLICFENGKHVHEVSHSLTPNGYQADCLVIEPDEEKFKRCPGYAYHNGPCAHIWAVHLHAQRDRTDEEKHARHIENALCSRGIER